MTKAFILDFLSSHKDELAQKYGVTKIGLIDMLEEKIPDYPWRMVKDFRNFIIHEYFGVDTKIVWDLTKLELDSLLHCVKMLQKETF